MPSGTTTRAPIGGDRHAGGDEVGQEIEMWNGDRDLDERLAERSPQLLGPGGDVRTSFISSHTSRFDEGLRRR